MSSANTISASAPTAMLACVLFAVSCVVSECVTVHRHGKEPDIHANSREELPSLYITCNLTDIVIISAPTAYSNNTFYYYLYNPNNDVTKIDIIPLVEPPERTKYSERTFELFEKSNYNVTNLNEGEKIDSQKDLKVRNNEFAIGPVGAQDHGNWVLSVYYMENGSWIEQFQVITIEIVEFVPIEQGSSDLAEGDTLELSFAYPLPDIHACQLVPPSVDRPFDRWHESNISKVFTCTYVLPNLTVQDSGTWSIIGVGKIVYKGQTTLSVRSKALSSGKDEKLVESSVYTSHENVTQPQTLLGYLKSLMYNT